jgi:hypothetical protein
VSVDKVINQPQQLYEDFVLYICLDHLDIVQNSLKPTFCTYMGLYLLRYLRKAVVENQADLSLFSNDFCANAKDSVKERLLLINDIYNLDPASGIFMDKCQSSLSNNAIMNPWYLPTIPTTILTFADVCSAYQDLFTQMNSKGLQSTSKAIQYSLILTLELDFNAKEEKLFNECTDSVVRQDPKKFCMVDIVGLTEFALWTDKEIDGYCTAAAT